MQNNFKVLVVITTLLALVVIVLGAYVRLKDAGLGCPDWPGCYGQLIGVPDSDQEGNIVDQEKAWIEVIHRYIAGILGILILILAIMTFVQQHSKTMKVITSLLVIIVLFQAILGALTVTQLLKPIIVISHLLGGMLILAILVAVTVSVLKPKGENLTNTKTTKSLILIFALLLLLQIVLGGWVSTNYAGLACGNNFPKCGTTWSINYDYSGFNITRELAKDVAGNPISQTALITIQWFHRIGALILTISAVILFINILINRYKYFALSLLVLFLLQLNIGIYIVVKQLPIFTSLLHNLGAALLVAWLVSFYIATAKHKI